MRKLGEPWVQAGDGKALIIGIIVKVSCPTRSAAATWKNSKEVEKKGNCLILRKTFTPTSQQVPLHCKTYIPPCEKYTPSYDKYPLRIRMPHPFTMNNNFDTDHPHIIKGDHAKEVYINDALESQRDKITCKITGTHITCEEITGPPIFIIQQKANS